MSSLLADKFGSENSCISKYAFIFTDVVLSDCIIFYPFFSTLLLGADIRYTIIDIVVVATTAITLF